MHPAPNETLHLVALGQSLIEHDLRFLRDDHLEQLVVHLTADVCFSNLEVAIKDRLAGQPTKEGLYFHAASPVVLDCLKDLGVNLLALCSNHAWDLGTKGIVATIHKARERGFVHAGTGKTILEAAAPAYLRTTKGIVALVAMASGALASQAIATDDRAGVNELRLGQDGTLNTRDVERNLDSIQSAASQADCVVVYQHSHYLEPDRQQTPSWQQHWARLCIDAGATMFVGHGAPLLHGMELYKNCPIFYNLGNFIFHTRTPPGHYERSVWESILVDCHFQNTRLSSLALYPLALSEGFLGDRFYQTRGVPRLAEGEKGQSILERFARMSRTFGVDMRIVGNSAHVEIQPWKS